MDETTESTPARPLLRVVRGDATPEEVAAVVALFAALRSTEPPARRPAPVWGANHRRVRQALPHGPGGWRSSALPR
ncbi:acyl-CoA carboxylase epsilon subunit [Nocardioides sp.]|uniref:acyl-CoA carboxylase epsilon subunit n=1 Tax=Nocardioides sp. TaxID=35761 RepID=UPI00260DF726|nr:acyl-CoA carboxylase epsilon subunit [Nocardioides sp.]MDI6912525.1 acyl-CoA carboxylase epsilon subunit [Nocardioides sp.]